MANTTLETQILKTLSFYTPMEIGHILIDLDKDFCLENPDLSYQELLETLEKLQLMKKVKLIKSTKEKKWIRVFPKRTLFQKIFKK